MKISRNDFTGTGKVYCFTLLQMLKGKANIITLLILFLATAVSIPVMALVMGGGEKEEVSGITSVYVRNDTEYELDLSRIPEEYKIFADTKLVDAESADTGSDTEWTEETYQSLLSSSEVYVHIQKEVGEKRFQIGAYTLEEKEFQDKELDSCMEMLSVLLNEARYAQLNAGPDQLAILTGFYDTDVQSVSAYLKEDEEDADGRFAVQMLYSFLLLMLCTFVSAYIIQKVIEEKASKLAELLMVSVSPLAMLLGKILAVMTYVFGLAAGLAAVCGISWAVTGRFADTSVLGSQMEAAGFSIEIFQLSPVTILVLVVSLLLGYLQVSLFSGLLGTGCSSTEDVEPANLTVVLLLMAGYFVAIFTEGLGGSPVLAGVVSLVPVASMFCAPVRYMVGDIGIGTVIISWAIQILMILLLAYVCARIYRALMMYRGNRMKLSGWIRMFRQNRGEESDCR